jgi:hypothetical protein
VGGTGGGIISRTFTVNIIRAPRASFTFQRVGLIVTFTDTSAGNPTQWLWDFGDGNAELDAAESGAHLLGLRHLRRDPDGAQQHRRVGRQQPGSDHH